MKKKAVGWTYNCDGEDKECVQNFDEETLGILLRRRPRRRCEDNVKMNFIHARLEGVTTVKIHVVVFWVVMLYVEDGGSLLLRNVGVFRHCYTASQPNISQFELF
jgi:hypothetical protein